MNYFIIVLIICFLIFLYVVYYLSHDDFVILRSNVPMERIYNVAFLFAGVTLFFSRLFYVIFNPQNIFLNPLGFLLFPYFPGLSLSGALLGGFIFLLAYLKLRNLPKGRLFDFFSAGFLIAYPVGLLGYFLLNGTKLSQSFVLSFILILVLLFIFVRFLLPFALSGKLKDGSLGIIFLFSFSGVSFLINAILSRGFSLSGENIIFLAITFLSLIPLVKQEGYEWYKNYLRRS